MGRLRVGFATALDIGIDIGQSTYGTSGWCLSYLADHAYLLVLVTGANSRARWLR